MRLGYDCGPDVLGAVSRRCRRVVLPREGRVVLAAELGRFAADADTAPGFLERRHNRSMPLEHAGPGAVAAKRRRSTETGSECVPCFEYIRWSGLCQLCLCVRSYVIKTTAYYFRIFRFAA